MKSLTVYDNPLRGSLEEKEIPTPGPTEVCIRIIVAGSNPKDWKIFPLAHLDPFNSGDDMAGFVHSVGETVTEFKAGDRVAAFHVMTKPWGSFAEFGIAPAHTTFHVPKNTSFEEAVTVPLAAGTAFQGLFRREKLALPTPLNPLPAGEKLPLLVYGASSAVGAFGIKLAKLANISPIIAICGAGRPFVETLGVSHIVDYREHNVVASVRSILSDLDLNLHHAFDAVSEGETPAHCRALLEEGGRHALVLKGDGVQEKGIVAFNMMVSDCHHSEVGRDLAFVYFRLIARWMEEGRFAAHPVEVVPGGLGGVGEALRRLKEGRVSARKLVFRVEETA